MNSLWSGISRDPELSTEYLGQPFGRTKSSIKIVKRNNIVGAFSIHWNKIESSPKITYVKGTKSKKFSISADLELKKSRDTGHRRNYVLVEYLRRRLSSELNDEFNDSKPTFRTKKTDANYEIKKDDFEERMLSWVKARSMTNEELEEEIPDTFMEALQTWLGITVEMENRPDKYLTYLRESFGQQDKKGYMNTFLTGTIGNEEITTTSLITRDVFRNAPVMFVKYRREGNKKKLKPLPSSHAGIVNNNIVVMPGFWFKDDCKLFGEVHNCFRWEAIFDGSIPGCVKGEQKCPRVQNQTKFRWAWCFLSNLDSGNISLERQKELFKMTLETVSMRNPVNLAKMKKLMLKRNEEEKAFVQSVLSFLKNNLKEDYKEAIDLCQTEDSMKTWLLLGSETIV